MMTFLRQLGSLADVPRNQIFCALAHNNLGRLSYSRDDGRFEVQVETLLPRASVETSLDQGAVHK